MFRRCLRVRSIFDEFDALAGENCNRILAMGDFRKSGVWQYGIAEVIAGLGVLSTSLAMAGSADVIHKCQDADGKWYYGEHLPENCLRVEGGNEAHSILTPRGVKLQVPQTPAGVFDQGAQERAAVSKAVLREDQRWLNRYSDEQAVTEERDRKLAELKKSLKTAQAVRTDLQRDIELLKAKKSSNWIVASIQERERSVAAYQQEIQHLYAEQKQVLKDYQFKLSRFREAVRRLGK